MYLNEKLKFLWHGCDYNPDQWSDYPEILKQDIQFMKDAGCNVMSVGIFSWAKLEPSENLFNFEWLDNVIDSLFANGIYTILATPSGAMPAWMAEKYPEIRRMADDGIRYRFGNRHNNCCSSLVYRQKVSIIDKKLAERYSKHPGVVMWHISNEYNVGDCHCPLCTANFQKWLEKKYRCIDRLNEKWWNTFWSHSYQNFSQILPPGTHGEQASNPLKLEWWRFKNDLLADFMKNEIDTVKSVDPSIPVTTNFMGTWSIDYYNLSKHLDVISWDNYPLWHSEDNEFSVAVQTAAFHSIFNSMKKDRSYMMMESSPSATNWQGVSKLRRPNMHLLASMQAIAHGSDTVQYFQWRKGRGQSEQFHGAVIGHGSTSDTRVFKDVQQVGMELEKIKSVASSVTDNEAAILFDYENVFSLSIAQAYRNVDREKGYGDVLMKCFGALWKLNIGCDFVFADDDFSRYKIIIAPMLFMLKSGLKEKIEQFTADGGIFIATFASGIIDEFGLCFFSDEYFPLKNVLGLKSEEIDCLYDNEHNCVELFGDKFLTAKYCDLIHPDTATVIGRYEKDFYSGMPAITINTFGKGKGCYIATDLEINGYVRLFKEWLGKVVSPQKMIESPDNVSITMRYDHESCYVFILNFNNSPQKLDLTFKYEILTGDFSEQQIGSYGVVVLRKTDKHDFLTI